MPEMISKKDAAERLGVSLPTIDRLIKERKLSYYKVGGSIKISVKDLEIYVESCRIPAILKVAAKDIRAGKCPYVPGMKVV